MLLSSRTGIITEHFVPPSLLLHLLSQVDHVKGFSVCYNNKCNVARLHTTTLLLNATVFVNPRFFAILQIYLHYYCKYLII